MPLPKFIHVRDRDRNIVSGSMETWINIDDVSRIGITCTRTPNVTIYLRSEPDRPVLVSGDEATALIATLRTLKK